MTPFKTLVVAMMLGIGVLTGPSLAADTAPMAASASTRQSDEGARTQALLDRAETHLREQSEQAMASFRRWPASAAPGSSPTGSSMCT